MKTKIINIIIAAKILIISPAIAQTINWAAMNDNKHLINVNAGIQHGVVFGAGYAHKINNKLFPAFAHIEYSFPSGNNFTDDFKSKIGLQIRWIDYNNFQFSTRIDGVFRRYENDFARLLNFGSDFSGIAGYYKSKWFVAGEFGFDKAIITHFKNSQTYKEEYLGVVNGWYEPTTGGNFYYGMQAGISLAKSDIYLRAGKTIAQDFKTDPLVPVYIQLGYNVKF